MSEEHQSLAGRIKQTVREIVDPGPEGEREGLSLVDEGTDVGSGFGTFGRGTLPAGAEEEDDTVANP